MDFSDYIVGFSNNEALRAYEFMLPAGDGTKLYTQVLMPEGKKKAPCIITRTPFAEVPEVGTLAGQFETHVLIREGCCLIFQHCRGCGGSEGIRQPLAEEKADTISLLKWVRQMPCYNGELYLKGKSFMGPVLLEILRGRDRDIKSVTLEYRDHEEVHKA